MKERKVVVYRRESCGKVRSCSLVSVATPPHRGASSDGCNAATGYGRRKVERRVCGSADCRGTRST